MNNYIYGEPPMLDMSDITGEEFNHADSSIVLIAPTRVSKNLRRTECRFLAVPFRDRITLKTLTNALGSHVINVLKRTDRAAEYLANWKVQCRIESDRCTVLRDGVVIGVGYYA